MCCHIKAMLPFQCYHFSRRQLDNSSVTPYDLYVGASCAERDEEAEWNVPDMLWSN